MKEKGMKALAGMQAFIMIFSVMFSLIISLQTFSVAKQLISSSDEEFEAILKDTYITYYVRKEVKDKNEAYVRDDRSIYVRKGVKIYIVNEKNESDFQCRFSDKDTYDGFFEEGSANYEKVDERKYSVPNKTGRPMTEIDTLPYEGNKNYIIEVNELELGDKLDLRTIYIDGDNPTTVSDEIAGLYDVSVKNSYDRFAIKTYASTLLSQEIYRTSDNVIHIRYDEPFFVSTDNKNKKFKVLALDEQGDFTVLDEVTEGGITESINLKDIFNNAKKNYKLWLYIRDDSGMTLQKIEVQVEFNKLEISSDNDNYDKYEDYIDCKYARQEGDTLYVAPNSKIYLDTKWYTDYAVRVEDEEKFKLYNDSNNNGKLVLETNGKIGDETSILLGNSYDDATENIKVVVSNGIVDTDLIWTWDNPQYIEEFITNDNNKAYTSMNVYANMDGEDSVFGLGYNELSAWIFTKDDIKLTDITGCLSREPEIGDSINDYYIGITINAKREGILKAEIRDYKNEFKTIYIKVENGTKEVKRTIQGDNEYSALMEEQKKYPNSKSTSDKMPEVQKIVKTNSANSNVLYNVATNTNGLDINNMYYYFKPVNDTTDILKLNNEQLQTLVNEKATTVNFDTSENQISAKIVVDTVSENGLYNLYIIYQYTDNGEAKIAAERTDTILATSCENDLILTGNYNYSRNAYDFTKTSKHGLEILNSSDSNYKLQYLISNQAEPNWKWNKEKGSITVDDHNTIMLTTLDIAPKEEKTIEINATDGVNENKYVYIYATNQETGVTTLIRSGSFNTVGEKLKIISTNVRYDYETSDLYVDFMFNKEISQSKMKNAKIGFREGSHIYNKAEYQTIYDRMQNMATFKAQYVNLNSLKNDIASVENINDSVFVSIDNDTVEISKEISDEIVNQIKNLQSEEVNFQQIEVNIDTNNYTEENDKIIIGDITDADVILVFDKILDRATYAYANVAIGGKIIAKVDTNTRYEGLTEDSVYSVKYKSDIRRFINEQNSLNGKFSILSFGVGAGVESNFSFDDIVYTVNGVETDKEIEFRKISEIQIRKDNKLVDENEITYNYNEDILVSIFDEYANDNSQANDLQDISLDVQFYGQENEPVILNSNGEVINPNLVLNDHVEENGCERGYILTKEDLPISFSAEGTGEYKISAVKTDSFGQEKGKELTIEKQGERIGIVEERCWVIKDSIEFLPYHNLSEMTEDEERTVLANYINYIKALRDNDKIVFRAAFELDNVEDVDNVKVYIDNKEAKYIETTSNNGKVLYWYRIPVTNTGTNQVRIEDANGTVIYDDEIDMYNYGLYKRGDANHDGKISPADSIEILRYIAKFSDVDKAWVECVGDVSNDDEVDVSDIVTLCRFIAEDQEVVYQWVKDTDK